MPKQSIKSPISKGAKSSFFNKLIPRSRKSQLVVFLLVFALIGGGAMAYRSFAASTTINYIVAEGLSKNPPFKLSVGGDVRGIAETKGQKANRVVLLLRGTSSSWATIGVSKPYTTKQASPTYFAAGKYRVCAVVKSETNSARFILAMLHANAKGGDPFQNGGGLKASTSDYKNVCQDITATQTSWPAVVVGRGGLQVSLLSITPISK